jgi:hypothetical protein
MFDLSERRQPAGNERRFGANNFPAQDIFALSRSLPAFRIVH